MRITESPAAMDIRPTDAAVVAGPAGGEAETPWPPGLAGKERWPLWLRILAAEVPNA